MARAGSPSAPVRTIAVRYAARPRIVAILDAKLDRLLQRAIRRGLLWDGPPARLIDAAQVAEIEVFTSRVLLAELTRILRRAKFTRAIAASRLSLDELVLGYAEVAQLVLPEPIAPVVVTDPDDDHVLACAAVAKADLIVSGDADLLKLAQYQGIPIVLPADALKRIPQH